MIAANSPTQETIRFELLFCCQFWNTPPCVDIWIDNTKIADLTIDKTKEYSFYHTCNFGPRQLRLVRRGKTDLETRLDSVGAYETQTLTLQKICIDQIDATNIVWHRCCFVPLYPEPWATEQKNQGKLLETTVSGETIFGHNGVWTFEFHSPFYQFVVDCVKGKK